MANFQFKEAEEQVIALWDAQSTYAKAKTKNKGAEPFYFLDGPPYTSGKVHIGTAWNKSLKDMVLRFKRMRGYDVWDRAGYDMHGLPTENATEKELGIAGRKQIEGYGIEKFIAECRKLCLRNLAEMNKVFVRLGVWMDFENAYRTISKEWMEGEWWLVKKAFENGRLYEGERSMTWDMHAATALAKHELVYQNVTDTAIYVRMRLKDEDAYFVIWTTTPWTIPFNLAIMANPDVRYCKVRVTHNGEQQSWYVAKDLLDDLFERKLKISYAVEEEILGKDLGGRAYVHPFFDDASQYADLDERMPNAYTVLLSAEHVDTSAGTGLVHCAPGCGPEDYEVGHRNGVRPFNTVDEHGYIQELAPFAGLRAKEQDAEFIARIERKGALIHTHKYTHDYPYGERSKQPVIFRTTKQWFLKVEDIKDELIKENNEIAWVPEAAYNAFNAWLENLRDNSISRQRYWGTPLPIWRNIADPDDVIVVGSAKQLAQLAGCEEPEDLHINVVDSIVIEKDGKTYRRVPDVLDVWVDAGVASWNCLDFPGKAEDFERLFPADFILEGKDQIRGWFNLLHIGSMVALGKKSFTACYMHGFVNDAQGRKMSKSIGNYILPQEVTEKYGVDATRYYMISAANPGYDMNYNFEDLEVKFKNLLVFWNTHNYLLDVCVANDIVPGPLSDAKLGAEERYILSRLSATIAKATQTLDAYHLNEVPIIVEEFLLDLSRTYIQLTREKASGSDEEKQALASTLARCLLDGMTLLAPICPYFAEQVYQNLKEKFPGFCVEESIHLCAWPDADEQDGQLESDVAVAKQAIAAILEARDKAQLGVRWPASEVRIHTAKQAEIERMRDLIMYQTNVKRITFDAIDLDYDIQPNYRNLGKEFGERTADIIGLIKQDQESIWVALNAQEKTFAVGEFTLTPEHLIVTTTAKEPWFLGEGVGLRVFLDTTRTDGLEREGFAREIVRRVQQLRKAAGLVKKDRIALEIVAAGIVADAAREFGDEIKEKTGAETLAFSDEVKDWEHTADAKVKGESFNVGFRVL